MSRSATPTSWLALFGLLIAAPVVAAPAVDVADLPPLPAASDDLSSSATVLAASSAEEDVVVGAAKREQTLGNVAPAVTVITAETIRSFEAVLWAKPATGVSTRVSGWCADENGDPSPRSPAFLGWNWTVYVPNLRGFDLTAGVRNLIGKREQVPAPGDCDRSMPDVLTVPRVPGEGRELYVKLGYSY